MGGVKLAAVLWDLDGTIIDSEPYWLRAESELAANHSAHWSAADGAAHVGQAMPATARALIARGVPLTVDEIARELFARMVDLFRTEGLPYRPGALELLGELAAVGLPQALVTMSYGSYVAAALAALPDGAFHVVRTGDSVARGKPAPDIYLAAAQDLELPPTQCLGVEDSGSGAQAILAAGVTPVVVPGLAAVPELPGLIRWDSLAGVTVAQLQETHSTYQRAIMHGQAPAVP